MVDRALWGLMTVTVFFGISALTILSVIAVPAIALLGVTRSGWRLMVWVVWMCCVR